MCFLKKEKVEQIIRGNNAVGNSIINGSNNIIKVEDKVFSELVLLDYKSVDQDNEDNIYIHHVGCSVQELNNIKNNIQNNVNEIKEIGRLDPSLEENNTLLNSRNANSYKLHMDAKEIDYIMDFCGKENISDEDVFFTLGNLRRDLSINLITKKNKEYLIGTKPEKKKYALLKEILDKIIEFKQKKFISEMDKYITLSLFNKGDICDENITVKLIFPKGAIFSSDDLLLPNIKIKDWVREKQLSKIHLIGNARFREYKEDYTNSGININDQDEYNKYYQDQVANFKKIQDNDEDIIEINFSYLRSGEGIIFPSVIFIKQDIKEFKYLILSNYSKNKEVRVAKCIIE